jgi:rRNA maturation protein Nop10
MMTSTYRECPVCGKRALSIATRCPQCGHELPTQPARWQASNGQSRVRPLLAVGVILLAAGGLVTLVVRWSADREPEAMATATARAEPPVMLDSASAAASPAMSDSAPSAGAVPRRARTWTKVRDGRSARADVVAVLLPGDSVLADSLRGGWWRVALEGRVLGYVHGRTLVQ